MYIIGTIAIGFTMAIYYANLLSVYYDTITKNMFLAPVIYTLLIVALSLIVVLVNWEAWNRSQRFRDRVKSVILCVLLRDDILAYNVLDQEPQEDQDIPACHVFVFSMVTLGIALLLCLIRLLWVCTRRTGAQGFFWFFPNPPAVDDPDSDESIEANDRDNHGDPNVGGLELGAIGNPANADANHAAISENQDAGAVGENEDSGTIDENGESGAIDENKGVAVVDENHSAATGNGNEDAGAIEGNQDAAIDQDQYGPANGASHARRQNKDKKLVNPSPNAPAVAPHLYLDTDASTAPDRNAPRQHRRSRTPQRHGSRSSPRLSKLPTYTTRETRRSSSRSATRNGKHATFVKTEQECGVRNRTTNLVSGQQ